MTASKLKAFLAELHASGVATAAAAVIGDDREIEAEAGVGIKSRKRPGRVTTSALFDLASLTKPFTATLALRLEERGDLSSSSSIALALGGAGLSLSTDLRRKHLGALLRHRSGLRPWTPLFERCRNASEVLRVLASSPELLGLPPSTYSDLGYILWGRIAELRTGRKLETLLRELVVRPLRTRGLQAPPGDVPAAVECRLANDRERELARGEGLEIGVRRPPGIGAIQDGNARFLGGVPGHAGLFGSARAVWNLAAEWARPGAVVELRSVDRALAGSGGYALGWRRRPPAAANRSGVWYGHTGFTGGGVWFCRETAEVRVLLAHRSSVSRSLDEWQTRFLNLRC